MKTKINLSIICLMTLIVPALVLPGSVENAFSTPKSFVILIGAALLTILNVQKLNKVPKIVWMLIAFNCLSLFYTLNPYYTKVAATLNISCLLFYFWVSECIKDPRETFILFFCVSLSGLFVAVVTWLQFFDIYIFLKWASPGLTLTGTIGNSNYLGAYLIFPVMTTMGLLFLIRGKWKFLILGMLPVILGAFIISRARASWLGFFCAFPIFLYMMWHITRSEWLRLGRVTIISLLCLLAVTIAYSVAPVRYQERMPLIKSIEFTTLGNRIHGYFPSAIHLWWTRNPLFGTGLWSYRNMVYEAQAELYEKDNTYFDEYQNPKPRRVHNDYLEALVDGGIVGSLLCLSFVVGVLFHGGRHLRQDCDKDRRLSTATALSCVIGIFVAALFFFPFRLNSTLFMTCLMLGVLKNRGDE